MTVTVRPAGVCLDPLAGQSVFAAAQAAGYRWPTVCGGHGSCRTCVMTVESGLENCSVIEDWEAEGPEALRLPLDGSRRLACQTSVSGDVVVHRRGVRAVSDVTADL